MKPIPLSAFMSSFTPPVTGVNGSPAPVANSYDSSGTFQSRGRTNSVKRRRPDEEIDVAFNLSAEYPPLVPPPRLSLDTGKIKRLMVAAAATATELRPVLTEDGVDPKTMQIAKLSISLFDTLEAVIEAGILPLSSTARKNSHVGAGEGAAKIAPPPPPKPAMPTGLKELREGLERAEKESVLFDADLGPVTLANRLA
jgi:hypothetical protein